MYGFEENQMKNLNMRKYLYIIVLSALFASSCFNFPYGNYNLELAYPCCYDGLWVASEKDGRKRIEALECWLNDWKIFENESVLHAWH